MRKSAVFLALALVAAAAAGASARTVASVHFPDNRPGERTAPATEENVNVAELDKLKAALKADEHLYVYCMGHASEPGGVEHNKELSRRRCAFVMHHLQEAGLTRVLPPRNLAEGESGPRKPRYNVPSGCEVDGPIVVCGETQATQNAAASRRVDLVQVHKKTTCGEFWTTANSCGNMNQLPFGDAPGKECAGLSDCREKCCHGTCGQFWGTMECPSDRPVRDANAFTLTQCGAPSNCAKTCCTTVTSPFEPRANPQTLDPRQPVIRQGRPARSCERWFSCPLLCAKHNMSMYNIGRGAGHKQQTCQIKCNNLWIRGCPGDQHVLRVSASNCASLCSKR